MKTFLSLVVLLATAGLCHAQCSNPDPDARTIETPQHRVNLRAFQMSKTEVTLGQFMQFITAAKRHDLLTDDFKKANAFGDNAPVVEVSWNDAQAFVNWLNKTDGGGWRLPTEAEWEYACRAGGSHKYCGGANLNAVAWYDTNSGGHQRNVGGKKPNAWGLYDMSGNVTEWVEDCFHSNYNGAPSDGSAWTSNCEGDGRGLRGGAWASSTSSTRAANRDTNSPGGQRKYIGFRLARTR